MVFAIRQKRHVVLEDMFSVYTRGKGILLEEYGPEWTVKLSYIDSSLVACVPHMQYSFFFQSVGGIMIKPYNSFKKCPWHIKWFRWVNLII
jgi:hypothetical protein